MKVRRNVGDRSLKVHRRGRFLVLRRRLSCLAGSLGFCSMRVLCCSLLQASFRPLRICLCGLEVRILLLVLFCLVLLKSRVHELVVLLRCELEYEVAMAHQRSGQTAVLCYQGRE